MPLLSLSACSLMNSGPDQRVRIALDGLLLLNQAQTLFFLLFLFFFFLGLRLLEPQPAKNSQKLHQPCSAIVHSSKLHTRNSILSPVPIIPSGTPTVLFPIVGCRGANSHPILGRTFLSPVQHQTVKGFSIGYHFCPSCIVTETWPGRRNVLSRTYRY